MPAGRPVKYETPEQMQEIIDQYFLDCIDNYVAVNNKTALKEVRITNDQRPTVSGLALVLDLTRQSLINYEGKKEFLATIKRAKCQIEAAVEQRLFDPACTGAIFNLKNNFDWKDKNETALTGANGGPIQTKTLTVVGVEPDKNTE